MPRSRKSADHWRRRARSVRTRLGAEKGTASLEFITAGVIMLLPLVYLVLTMASLQAGAFAVEGAARQAARVFVSSADVRAGEAAARRAVHFALDDYGFDPGAGEVRISCTPRPTACLTRNGTVTVAVRLSVPLPLVPAAIDVSPPSVPLSASAVLRVSRFHGAD